MFAECKIDTQSLIDRLVGRRFGILQSISFVPALSNEPPLFHCGGRLANTHPETMSRGFNVGGSGLTKEQAVLSALGEGIERYCAGSYSQKKMHFATFDEMREKTIDIRWLSLFRQQEYNKDNFPYQQPQSHIAAHWVEGTNLIQQEKIWLPANLVYVPYMNDAQKQEAAFCPSLSTGLACGQEYSDTTLKAICEVIERDALTLMWLNRVHLYRLPTELWKQNFPFSPPVGDDIYIFDLTTDMGIPVYFVLGIAPSYTGNMLYVGSACYPNGKVALHKAIKEALQDRAYVRCLLEKPADWCHLENFSGVNDFPRHAQFYSRRPELIPVAFSFLVQAPIKQGYQIPHIELDLNSLTNLLAQKNLTLCVYNLSQPWVEELGMTVVKAILPELIHLHGNHNFIFWGHPRLQSKNVFVHQESSIISDYTTIYPHPFP